MLKALSNGTPPFLPPPLPPDPRTLQQSADICKEAGRLCALHFSAHAVSLLPARFPVFSAYSSFRKLAVHGPVLPARLQALCVR